MKNNVSKKINYFIFLNVSIFYFLILLLKTPIESFDLLETLKLFGPIVTLGFVALLREERKLKIVKYGFYILINHIILGFIQGVLSGPSNMISEDGRLTVQLLGRGAGETAWAFCVLLVSINYLCEIKYITISSKVKKITQLIILLLIVLTQTRSALLFIIVYIIARNKIKMKLTHLMMFLFIFTLFVVLLLTGDIPIFTQIIERSMSTDTILTGREYIWATQMAALTTQDFGSIFFGENLAPKIHEIAEIAYVTADPHNLYIDLVQYYGVLGLVCTILWYRAIIVKNSIEAYSVVISFAIMSMFVSSFRYPVLFYANVILLLIPTIETKK